jgi:uncharacterized protein (DUF362 family)
VATVVISDASSGLQAALDRVFTPHGGIAGVIGREGGTVYLKPNGIHFAPGTYTDPRVLEAVLAYLRDHGYRRLAVMEGCTAGNFTRLVFQVTGYRELCKRYSARPVYLDEGPVVPVDLADGTRVRVAKRLRSEIIERRNNFYLSLPKLKTHSMSTVSLGVKNQQAFPIAADRMERHSGETLHARLAALYALTRPDFCIVEGLTATAHGHFPATALLRESLVPLDVLVGGTDTLAVDVVAARILGYELHEVEHLRLCAEQGLGVGDLAAIDVRGVSLSRFRERIPATLLRRFHPEVRWVVGRERACTEGCRGNSECIQEMLFNDYHGRGGWTLVLGQGFRPGDFDDLPGDILIVGPCACGEAGPELARRYPRRRIFLVPEHNDLMSNTRFQARLMGVAPLKMVPLNPVRAAWILLQAKLHGLKARVPPLMG